MNRTDDFLKKYYFRLYLLILSAAACAYVLLLGGNTVWCDEAYTFALIRHPFGELCRLTAADVHPPLYYLILKILTAPFGYRLLPAKIVSLLPFLGILGLGGIQFRKLFGEKTALLFMGLFLLFPYTLTYSVEIRMYSMGAFFVFANGVFALRAYRDGGWLYWILFALMGTAAAYTHYFALVSAGIIYGLLFLAIVIRQRKKLLPWLGASAVTVVLYVPWLKCFIEQLIYKANNDYWISAITAGTVKDYITTLFGCAGWDLFALFASLSYMAAFLILLRCGVREDLLVGLCALAVPAGTMLVGIAASILVRPIFIIRYIIPSVPMLAAFMAVSLSRCKKPAVLACILTVAALGGITNYFVCLQEEYAASEEELGSAFLAAYEDADCIEAVGCDSGFSYVVSYYEPEIPIYTDESIPLAEDALPFENIILSDSADMPDCGKILLFAGSGENIPEKYLTGYTKEYIGGIMENGSYVSAYLLTAEGS